MAQYEQYIPYIEPYLNAPIVSGYFHFKTPNNIQAGQLYQWYKITAPDLDNDMVLTSTYNDSIINYTHYKYQQTYKGIPIEGAGCLEHYDMNGNLRLINAKIADSINCTSIPRISRTEE